jgi:hypothetical protein
MMHRTFGLLSTLALVVLVVTHGLLAGSPGGLSHTGTLAKLEIAERAFFLIDQPGIVRQRWLVTGREDMVFSSAPLLEAARELAGKP